MRPTDWPVPREKGCTIQAPRHRACVCTGMCWINAVLRWHFKEEEEKMEEVVHDEIRGGGVNEEKVVGEVRGGGEDGGGGGGYITHKQLTVEHLECFSHALKERLSRDFYPQF